MLIGVAVFQALLAAGLPWGHLAWGGRHNGMLPAKLRIGSVVASLFLVFSAAAVLSHVDVLDFLSRGFTRYFMWFLAAYCAIGIPTNLASKSKAERLWAPYVGVMLALCLVVILG